VVGGYLSSIMHSVAVFRFGHCVMWLVGPYHPYCLVSQLEDHSMNSYCYQKLDIMFWYLYEADCV